MYFDSHPLLCYSPDKGYPISKLNSTGKLSGKYITREHLLSCIDDVNLAIERQTWTVATCKTYLRTEGFNQKAIDDIIDFAQNHVTYTKALRCATVEREKWAVISKDYESDPTKYQHYRLPSSWFDDYQDTSLYVDVPMHLLLLGVGKSVFIKVSKWLKIKMQASGFKEISKGVLDQIKLYCLEWCKILQYPYNSSDKFGGWVAENFLGFVRISNWFYSLLHELKKTREVPNLETPHTAWRVRENKFWLEIRGLPTEGSAKVLTNRVRTYLEMETPPAILPTTELDKTHILSMINSLNEMISMMLSLRTRYEDLEFLEIVIRKFLIAYDLVDSRMIQKSLPSWMTQYNFLCLLNIPKVMRKYGCMRNIWEGGVEGEGFLRKYKRELRNGLKPKWEMWTVKNLLQRVVFQKELIDKDITDWKSILKYECRIYQSISTIDTIVLERKPLSCIFHNEDNTLYIIYRRKHKFHGIIVDIDWDEYIVFNYLRYYHITMSNEVVNITCDIVMKSTGCLLLPRISNPDNTFCIVYSDWRRLR
jgi:hypothetical protein